MTVPPSHQPDTALVKLTARQPIDLFIQAGLLSFLVIYCYEIFKPFIGLMLWSIILAVALNPVNTLLAGKMGGKPARASGLLVMLILLAVLIPTSLLAISFADTSVEFVKHVHQGTFQIPAPPESISAWPIVGDKLHTTWAAAHSDLGSVLAKIEPKIGAVTKRVLGYAASTGTAILKFLVSLVLAGAWMAYAAKGHGAATAIARRMLGSEKGDRLITLSTSTIRAVAQGVIGIACIQALLLGAGFIVAGIPAAGVLALVVLLLGIMQIPASLVSVPAIIYVFSTNDSTMIAVLFAAYMLIAGTVDNVLKPMILGRGVDAPMPVILLGALGGMASSGIIGMFLGAVMLALGYQLSMAWVYEDQGQNLTDHITG